MFRFFRSIRQQLLAENKTIRYLKYAVGEIVLIVVGIMIALQLNNWNEARVEADLEKGYLLRLAGVIQQDVQKWHQQIPLAEKKEASLAEVLQWLNDPIFDEDGLRTLATKITEGSHGAYAFDSNEFDIVFNEMVSTGRLHLISNLDLRERLIRYVWGVQIQKDRLVSRVSGYAKRAYELVPRDPEFTVVKEIDFEFLKRMGQRALETDLESLVIAERNRSRLRQEITAQQIEWTEELLAALNQELESNH